METRKAEGLNTICKYDSVRVFDFKNICMCGYAIDKINTLTQVVISSICNGWLVLKSRKSAD